MRLITIFELATLSERELQALFRETTAELARAGDTSADRRNALATLENISSTLRQRAGLPCGSVTWVMEPHVQTQQEFAARVTQSLVIHCRPWPQGSQDRTSGAYKATSPCRCAGLVASRQYQIQQ